MSIFRQLRHPIPWLGLILALGSVIFIWQQQAQLIQINTRFQFDRETERTRQAITNRMAIYEGALIGTRGLFAANKSVGKNDWQQYITTLALQERFPGVNGIGYIAYVPGSQRTEFEQATRTEAPAYSIKTSGNPGDYFAVKYIEPFIENFFAWGLDIGTDSVSRKAAEEARDSGEAVLSGKTALMEKTNNGVGFLLFLPIYQNGMPQSTVEERRNALQGWTYASFRVDTLMHGILGNETPQLDFEIFDGDQADAATLLYDDDRVLHVADSSYRPSFSSLTSVKLNGRTWALNFTTTAAFDNANANSQPTTFLIGGIIASLLLFFTLTIIISTRSKLVGILRQLRNQSEQLKTALAELEGRQRTGQHVSRQVLSLASQLNSTASQQASGSQEQASVVSQINVAVGELSATAASIDELAQQVDQTARSAARSTQEIEEITTLSVRQSQKGLSAVASTLSASEQVARLYQELRETLNELNRKNASMKRILELLKSFSDETHLLALNASIEAAGAGEYGERFSVVAQEVKKLALRSTQANREVVEIVRQVEASTLLSVQTAENGYLKAKELEQITSQTEQVIADMREVAENSQKQIGSIVESIKEVSALAEIIQTATNQQHSASVQVQEALNGLSTVAYQTAEGSSQISTAVVNLEELSQNLNLALVA